LRNSGCGVHDLGFKVEGSGLDGAVIGLEDWGLRVEGWGAGISGVGFRV
jgi:hypothetical protein